MGTNAVPRNARVVIIGGGISGCSVAWHLAELGWRDILLLERKQLTCGTTWHAAGLIGQLRNSANLTRLAKYSLDLYRRLEDETGVATGLRQGGAIALALTAERREELVRQAAMARVFGVVAEEIDSGEIAHRYPHVNLADVETGIYLPDDAQADPANIAYALASGARRMGVKILEGVAVTAVHQRDGRVSGVSWQRDGEAGERGQTSAEVVVNCAGLWARELGALSGVSVPLHACEHFYIVTESIDGLEKLPVLRVPDECAYYKEDAGKMLLGAFEPRARPWGQDGIPEAFCFDQLPYDFDHFAPILAAAVERLPLLQNTGIHSFFNGPESFTPDNHYLLGEAPELRGYFVAAGYNSIGIASAGGAGMALAQWIRDGEPPFDLWDVDIRRMQPFQSNPRYLRERVSESLGLLYADHFPHRQPETARGVRRSPLHEHLARAGACFGEVAGWERPNWFAREGQAAEYRYSWQRQNWFDNAAAEHRAVRGAVGLFDMTGFGKIRVQGVDAEPVLNRICGADIAMPVGAIRYTQFLNERGGIEADVTVSRLSANAFLVVTPVGNVVRDLAWLRRHTDTTGVVCTDVTSAEAVLAVMGPRSRELLGEISSHDFSTANHPFGTLARIDIGMATARAHRITYVGELGWELYIPTEQAAHAFEAISAVGDEYDLMLCGFHVLDSCRLEKGYRHFGHDITDEDHVLEAGLGFAVARGKADFIGREAVEAKRSEGLNRRLLQFRLQDPEPLLYRYEPIFRDGHLTGHLTSGNYAHHLGTAIGMGYVTCTEPGEPLQAILASDYQIEIVGRQYPAEVSSKPFYDPTNARIRE